LDSAERYMRANVVGNYRIIGPLGTGGMGTVYGAEHVLIGRLAAVKVLLPQYGRNRGIVTRFFNEARAVGAIQHPGIVELYDFGHMDDGSAYIVMELLRGETLAGRIAGRGRLTEAEALAIVRGIAGALGAVHAKGIVHRDIKPDNVFLVPDLEAASGERVKVLDFGIAKLTDDRGALNRTSTNSMLGTPMYMAPEQCRGADDVDHRADLYSLGCVLFEMIAGVPPFLGEGAGEVIAAHLHIAPPALRTLAREVSPSTDQIVAALLAKHPEDRVQTAHELIELLDGGVGATFASSHAQVTIRLTSASHPAVSTTLGTAAGAMVLPPTPSRPRGHAFAGIAAAGLAVAVAASVFVLGARGRVDPDESKPPPATVEAARPSPSATANTTMGTANDAAMPAAPPDPIPISRGNEPPAAAPVIPSRAAGAPPSASVAPKPDASPRKAGRGPRSAVKRVAK
jgi:hypothetical protein